MKKILITLIAFASILFSAENNNQKPELLKGCITKSSNNTNVKTVSPVDVKATIPDFDIQLDTIVVHPNKTDLKNDTKKKSNVTKSSTVKIEKKIKDLPVINVPTTKTSMDDPINFNPSRCFTCHGSHWEKKALNVSNVVANMSSKDILSALRGYKNDTYGGKMKPVMKSQIKNFSDSDLVKISQFISENK